MTSSGLSWETAVENQAFILSPPSKSISLQTCEVKPKAASYPMITQKWFRQDQWQKFPSHAKLTYSVAFLPHRNENLKIWNFSQNTFNRKRKKKKKQYQDVLFKLLLSFYICQSSCHPTSHSPKGVLGLIGSLGLICHSSPELHYNITGSSQWCSSHIGQ